MGGSTGRVSKKGPERGWGWIRDWVGQKTARGVTTREEDRLILVLCVTDGSWKYSVM